MTMKKRIPSDTRIEGSLEVTTPYEQNPDMGFESSFSMTLDSTGFAVIQTDDDSGDLQTTEVIEVTNDQVAIRRSTGVEGTLAVQSYSGGYTAFTDFGILTSQSITQMPIQQGDPDPAASLGDTTVKSLNINGLNNALLVTDDNGNVVVGEPIDLTELSYLDGVTSNIQTQLNARPTSDTIQTSLDAKTDVVKIGNTSFTNATDNHITTASISSDDAFAALGFSMETIRTIQERG